MSSSVPNEKVRFFKFAIVGFSGTVVDFGIFNLLSSILSLPTIPSSVISFLVAVLNNFYWNRHWTYPESRHLPLSGQLGKFGLVSVAGLITRTFIFSSIETPLILMSADLLPNYSAFSEIIGHNLTLATVIIIVLFWNYFANKVWTYKGI